MRRIFLLLPFLCALAACEDKPGANTSPSATAHSAPTASARSSATSPTPGATGATASSAASPADPAGTLEQDELLKKVKEKKADWIGKEVVVRGPYRADFENLEKKKGFTYSEVGTPSDSISVVLKNQDDMAKISPLGSGSAIIVVRAKIKDFSLGQLSMVDAEILDIRKTKK